MLFVWSECKDSDDDSKMFDTYLLIQTLHNLQLCALFLLERLPCKTGSTFHQPHLDKPFKFLNLLLKLDFWMVFNFSLA